MNVTEVIHNNTHMATNGKLNGQVRYEYTTPTHWSSPCSVIVWHNPHRNPDVTMNYGSGGCNKGFTEIQIAKALSDVFAMAAERMIKIEQGETT